MSSKPEQARNVGGILQDDALVGAALREALRQAIHEHKQEGLPLAVWRDGKVVWVPAEELEAEMGDGSRAAPAGAPET